MTNKVNKIMIIGHVNHGTTCLQSAIDCVLEKERGVVISSKHNPFEPEPMIISNYREYFNEPEPIQKRIFDKPKSKYHK